MPVYLLSSYSACDEYPYVGASLDIVPAEDGVGGLAKDDSRLRSEATENLLGKIPSVREKLTNVIQREISREKLLELAKEARTRKEIIADRLAQSNI